MASRVTLVEIAAEDEMAGAGKRLDDVSSWLKRHGIAAEPFVVRATGDDASAIEAVAREQSADVIVAGAYGHSRSEEHTSELQSLMRISYAVFCLKKKNKKKEPK